MYSILVANSDATMLQMMDQILTDEGYFVETASSSEDVLGLIDEQLFDLFLVDLDVAGGTNAIGLCERLRHNPVACEKPIVLLAPQTDVERALKALEVGGDDYLRKPFAIRELTARIRAHLRRVNQMQDHFPSVQINPDTYQVFVENREITLTRMEFDLLYFMINSPKKWHATNDLLANVWNYPDGVGDTALVRNHIRNLRLKLEADPDHPNIILSRHGRGYTIHAKVRLEVAV